MGSSVICLRCRPEADVAAVSWEVWLEFIVPGEPYPKQRGRTVSIKQRGRVVGHRTFTPKETEKFEKRLKWYARIAMNGAGYHEPLDGPVGIEVDVIVSRPKTIKKRVLPHVKPDLDNVVKSVMDACEKIIWANDSRICRMVLGKDYGEPGVRITIYKGTEKPLED